MKYVHSTCYDELNEDCSKLGHKEINWDYSRTDECVKNTFEGSKNVNLNDNKVLREF